MMHPPPSYTKPEIERRWLLQSGEVWDVQATREREIEDRYIDGTRLRLRRVVENGLAPIYKIGKKYEPVQFGFHHVVSTYLSEAEYRLLSSLPARIARKRRLSVHGGALDIYEAPNKRLNIFEVEFSSKEAAAGYLPPFGVDKEITDDPSYSGHALAVPEAADDGVAINQCTDVALAEKLACRRTAQQFLDARLQGGSAKKALTILAKVGVDGLPG